MILSKKYPKYSKNEIDELFEDMDIKDEVIITKDLLKAIIQFMSM